MPFLWLLFCHWPLWKLLYETQVLFFTPTKSKLNPDKSPRAAICWLPQTRVTQPQTIRSVCSGLGMGLIVHHIETCWNRFAGQRLPQYLLHLCLPKTVIIHADRATHSSELSWGWGKMQSQQSTSDYLHAPEKHGLSGGKPFTFTQGELKSSPNATGTVHSPKLLA